MNIKKSSMGRGSLRCWRGVCPASRRCSVLGIARRGMQRSSEALTARDTEQSAICSSPPSRATSRRPFARAGERDWGDVAESLTDTASGRDCVRALSLPRIVLQLAAGQLRVWGFSTGRTAFRLDAATPRRIATRAR